MAKRTTGMTWMRVLVQDDLVRLKRILTASSPKRQEWEYKLRGGNIIINVPIIPWNAETHKPDPSIRYMARHLRIVPVPGGPFQLEYMRHTGQWWPVFEAVGDLETIVNHIESDPFGACGVCDSHQDEKPKRQPSMASASSKGRIGKKPRRKQ